MANFDIAYNLTAKYEGGYANVKGDNGGETYAGIARRYWSSWEGWKIVDAHKPLKHNQVINNAKLKELVKDFYKKNFWDPIKGDQIVFQDLANRIYDFGVNAGVKASIQMVERALGLTPVGKMTDELLKTINNPTKRLIL